MLQAVLILGSLGLLFGGLLAFAAKKLAVETDPLVESIRDNLPGINCGACGYAGCDELAKAVARKEALVTSCVPGGIAVAEKLAEIMGTEKPTEIDKKVAVVLCCGDNNLAKTSFDYDGVQDCRAAFLYGGGHKTCPFSCLGLGSCAAVCPFDAITMSKTGLPLIDQDKCMACGKCKAICPKKVIELVSPEAVSPIVKCRSTQKGKEVRAVCDVGCIACGICVKNCPEGAIVLENNLAKIDPDKCTNCGICVEKCPRKCIL